MQSSKGDKDGPMKERIILNGGKREGSKWKKSWTTVVNKTIWSSLRFFLVCTVLALGKIQEVKDDQ